MSGEIGKLVMAKMLSDIIGGHGSATPDGDKPYDAEHFDSDAKALKRIGAEYLEDRGFKPGDIVRLNPDINPIYSKPRAGQPCIVLIVKPDARHWAQDETRSTHGAKIDLNIGFLDADGEFVTSWYDSGYFCR